MKKTILLILLSVFATLVITLVTFEIIAQREQLSADQTEEFHSVILRETRKILVHLPKDYSTNLDKNYPVVYALDATSHDQLVLNAASVLSSAEILQELIVVGIVNEDRHADMTPDYIMQGDDPTEFGEGGLFLDFLEQEVISLIEKNYRTTNYRMISGNSRSGLFAFYSLLEKPNLFDAYFCYSPAFWRDDNLIVEKAAAFFEQKQDLHEFLYLSLGTAENDKMKSGFDAMVEVLEKNDSIGVKSIFKYTENADHGTNAFYSIPHALKTWSKNR